MPAKRLVPLVVAVAMLAAALFAATAQAVPSRLIGLGSQANRNTLYSFSGDALSTVTVVPVTGLGGANLAGISFRPADGQLYGVGISGNTETVFKVDPGTGAATLVGSATPVGGTIALAFTYGVDFNPVSDRLRVVDSLKSNAGSNINNFRVNPNNGAIAGIDTDLNFTALPEGEPGNEPLATIAYDRSVAGATATTLFGLAANGDRLVRLGGIDGNPSPNTGVLTNVGLLGVDMTSNAGLDIDPATGEAYAILQVAGASGLYRIDLATGAATLIGNVAGGTINFGSLAIVPPPPPVIPAPQPPSPIATTPPPAPVVLKSLKVAPFAFVPGASGGPIGTNKASRGTKVSYTLSAVSSVRFRIEKAVPGKRRKFRLLKPTFVHTGQRTANSFRFSGRLNGKALAPGRYKLVGSVGTSSRSASFEVVASLASKHG